MWDLLADEKTMKLGDSDFAMTKDDLSIAKWRDRGKKSVIVVSSLHDPSCKVEVQRTDKTGKRETVKCPESIADYNRFMGGVDLFDQLLSCYSISWKSRRWWIKILYYLIDSSIVNSFILYKTSAVANGKKPMTHLQFRSQLANELIGDYYSRKRMGAPVIVNKNKLRKEGGRAVSVENFQRTTNVGSHLPLQGPKYRRCAYCSTKKKVKRSRLICEVCNVALCQSCFTPFHK